MTAASDYTGHVDPQSAAATRDLPALQITKLSVGPMDNNAYLLVCRRTGAAVLIDAANDADRLLAEIGHHSGDGGLRGIVTTHRHSDHWQALQAVAAATGASIYAGAADADELPVEVDIRLRNGDTVPCGDATLDVIALRGHTPGSIALLYRGTENATGDGTGAEPPAAHVFTGDSLFPGGPGRTASPADFASLMDDLSSRIFGVLPDSTWIYPGHGDDTTLGAERPHLAEWRARGW